MADPYGLGDDPFAGLNALKRSDTDFGLGGPGRAKARFPALPAPAAEPLKASLLDKTVSGLSWVGQTLDKTFGGRAVRGVLAGKPHEALSVLPFSDTLGLTDPKNSTSGQELLNHHGYHPEQGNWLERNVVPLATEVALDPSTYLNPFGAATKAGKLAEGLGHTAGWSRSMLQQGFTHSESALRALGRSGDDIAHLANHGLIQARILPEALETASRARGINLGVGQPLRGAVGIGLPFTEPAAVLGQGAVGRGQAALFDRAGQAISHSAPVRHLRTLFDDSVGRVAHGGVQDAVAQAGRPASEAAGAAGRLAAFEGRHRLDELVGRVQDLPGLEPEVLRLMRGAAESAPQFADPGRWAADFRRRAAAGLATGVANPNAVEARVLAHFHEASQIGHSVRDYGRHVLEHSERVGLPLTALDDPWASYAARRYIAANSGFGGSEWSRHLPTTTSANLHRKLPLTNLPGGSEQINEWAINPALSGAGRTAAHPAVEAEVLADLVRNHQLGRGAGPSATELASYQGHARELAHWLLTVPDAHAAHGIPYFNPDLIGDLEQRAGRFAKVEGGRAALTQGSVNLARPIGSFGPGEKHLPLGDFLGKGGKAGLTTDAPLVRLTPAEEVALRGHGFSDRQHARDLLSNPALATPAEAASLASLQGDPALLARVSRQEWTGAGVEAYRLMARHGFPQIADLEVNAFKPLNELNQFGLRAEDADALATHLAGWTAPSETRPFLGAMSGAQNLFKNLVYPLWPASHVRNLVSALYNNTLHGTTPGDYLDALRITQGKGVPAANRYGAAFAALSPEQRATQLKGLSYAHGKVFGGVTSFQDTVGGRGLTEPRLRESFQGQGRVVPRAPGTHGPFHPFGAGWANPLHQQGVLGHTEDGFLPLRVGRAVGTGIEDNARLANFLGGLRQGLSPEKSGELVRKVHFDYSANAPFERNVLKQVVPFYTFMRKNLPYQAEMALTQPNKVAPVIRAIADAQGDRWRPEYLSSGAAIPLGAEGPDGNQTYLAKLGLPMEEAFERLKFRNYELGGRSVNLPSLSQTGLAFAGSVTPYLKAPLEFFTNTQFHTGRNLTDLQAKGLAGGYGLLPEEYAQPLTHLASNSPLARVVSTIDRAVDNRHQEDPAHRWGKFGLNFLSGVKVTDVDLNKQRAVAARKELEHGFQTDPRVSRFTNFYPRPDLQGPLPAELVERLRLYTTMKQDAKTYHEAMDHKKAADALLNGNPLRRGLP